MPLSSLPIGSNTGYFVMMSLVSFLRSWEARMAVELESRGSSKQCHESSSQKTAPCILPRVELQDRSQTTWIPLSPTSGPGSSFLGASDHSWVLHGCIQSGSRRLLTCHGDRKV